MRPCRVTSIPPSRTRQYRPSKSPSPGAAAADRSDGRHPHRPLLAGLQQPVHELLTIEPLARPVLLHGHVRNLVDPLIAREALGAVETLATPPDDLAFLALPRVDTLVAEVTAIGTLHARASPLVSASSRIRDRFNPTCAAKYSPNKS